MISVDEALELILRDVTPLAGEEVPISDVMSRVAASDSFAKLTQPPFPASAMDGYAVRLSDAEKGNRLRVIGEAPAGQPFNGSLRQGEAVRLFTGSVVPDGADHILIQEHTDRKDDALYVTETQEVARHIRKAGADFNFGELLVSKGDRLREIHCSLLAAANFDRVSCVRKPKVVVFSNGDELKEPGSDLEPGQIINSNHYALSALIRKWGGEPIYVGCVNDVESDIRALFVENTYADVIVPVGGASVGDYDFVKSAFSHAGGVSNFDKIAVRPGKPTWYGTLESARILGLPGNPASAIVTAVLFLKPLIEKLSGIISFNNTHYAKLFGDLSENGRNETYLRAAGIGIEDQLPIVRPFENQDSSLLSPFAKCDYLIRRGVNAKKANDGEEVEIVPIR